MKRLAPLVIAVIFGIVSASSAFGLQLPGPLVSTDWLQSHLADKKLVVIDLRSETDQSAYEKGHIPGARFLAWEDVRAKAVNQEGANLDYAVPSSAELEKRMQKLGVQKDSSVVIVSTWENPANAAMATRLYWTLKYYGDSAVAVLDGGTARWIAEKLKTEAGSATPALGNFRVQGKDESIRITAPAVLKAVEDKNAIIVDGRTPDFFRGEKKKGYVATSGHIPKAVNIPMPELLDPATQRLKSASSLKEIFLSRGITPDKPVIVYCDSGHLSTLVWFALKEVCGYPDVRQFDSSLHEWTKNPACPMVLGD